MNIKKITPRFFVSGQLSIADIGAIAASGIRTIFCNRPDNEKQGQPKAGEIAAAAEGLGITFVDLPVVSGFITEDNLADFERACRDAQGPILAYCRTGMRSISLWALTEAKTLDTDAVLSATKEAGYDLSAMRSQLLGR